MREKLRLKDKVSIVTGGGRGIGKAIALALAKEGSRVAIVARTEKELEKVAKEIGGLGSQSEIIIADISVEKQVEEMVKGVIRKFGRIDILVNNAGIAMARPIIETNVEDWDRMMRVNLRGTFLCSKAVLSVMIREKIKGSIVNISSITGKKGYLNQSAYCASKFGVVGFSKVLAMEAKPFGIRVNVICPGSVNTELIGKVRPDISPSDLMQPEDVAWAVIFLVTQPARVAIDELVMTRFMSES